MAILSRPAPGGAVGGSQSHSRGGSAVMKRWKSMTTMKNAAHRSESAIHNAGLPISRLPGEVIEQIFSWYILGVCTAVEEHSYWSVSVTKAEATQHYPRCPRPYSWLFIRHVCQAWRQVALTYPELSTHICLTRPDCVEELLGRAGTLPLHVYDPSLDYMRLHYALVMRCRDLVRPHASRIHRGVLLAANGAIDIMPSQYDDNAERGEPMDITSLLTPRPDLGGPSLLRLEDLTPSSQSLSRTPSTFSSLHLRRLALVQRTYMPPPTGDLLALLAPFARLEVLELRGVLPRDAGSFAHLAEHNRPNGAPAPTLALPHLRVLRIAAPTAAAALHFTSRMAHPPDTTLDLAVEDLTAYPHADCACMPALARHAADTLTRGGAAPLLSLRIAVDGAHGLDLCLWTHALAPAALRLPPDAAPPQLRLSVQHCDDTKRAFAALVRALPLAHVAAAALLDRAPRAGAVQWAPLLRALPALGVLTVDAHSFSVPSGVGQALGGARDVDARGLCPALRDLDVRESRGARACSEDYAGLVVTLADVARALAARAVPGGALRAVVKARALSDPLGSREGGEDEGWRDEWEDGAGRFAGRRVEPLARVVIPLGQTPAAAAAPLAPVPPLPPPLQPQSRTGSRRSVLRRFMSLRRRDGR